MGVGCCCCCCIPAGTLTISSVRICTIGSGDTQKARTSQPQPGKTRVCGVKGM